MASNVIDLTNDESPNRENLLPTINDSPTKFIYSKSRVQLPPIQQAQRAPLKPLQNYSTNDSSRGQLGESEVLVTKAIDGMKAESLRALLKKVCAQNANAMALVRSEVLVTSDKVVPYHADSDSEGREESEEEEEDEEDDEEDESESEDIKPKSSGGQCIRCPEANWDDEEEEYDVCFWHTGEKEVNYDSEVWYDYNEGLGPEEDHVDDYDYADGFIWTCCGAPGSDSGCKKSKTHDDGTEPEPKKPTEKSLKRKASEAELEKKRSVYVSKYMVCENCKEEFDVTNNTRGDCVWHTDIKDVDYDALIWADHDEDCHGTYESFENDPYYADGFMWQCCEKPGGDPGCQKPVHKALKVQERKKPRY